MTWSGSPDDGLPDLWETSMDVMHDPDSGSAPGAGIALADASPCLS